MKTDRFRLSTGAYFTRLVYLHGTLSIAVILVLFLASVVLAFALDLRFALIAVMIALLILPLAIAYLYFYFGLMPDYSFNVSWHTLELSDKGIEVTLFKPVYERTVDEETEEEKETITGWEATKRLFFPRDSMGPMLAGGDGMTIRLKNGRGMIAVPRNAFSAEEDFRNFISHIPT